MLRRAEVTFTFVPTLLCTIRGSRFRCNMMGPRIFFRVEDDDSRARYKAGRGILAEDRVTAIDFGSRNPWLSRHISRHLNRSNRVATPFISTYCLEEVAREEAQRRVDRGKEGVRVYKIDIGKTSKRREWRSIRRLARGLRYDIPECAWSNSEYEYIFLHLIPSTAVVGRLKL
jgi:hypothetical protein